MPRIRCRDASYDCREVALGRGSGLLGTAILVRHDYGACRAGCCQARSLLELQVPCEELPHCGHCECGSEHRFTLADEQVAELKAILR